MELSFNKAKKKANEYKEVIKDLNIKLLCKEEEFKKYQATTIEDFAIKEIKTVELINKLIESEDQNYKLLHYNKDTDKKKFIIMDKQIKQFTRDLQKYLEENNKLETILSKKESELIQVRNEYIVLYRKNKRDLMSTKSMVNMSFAKGQNCPMSIIQTKIQSSTNTNNQSNDNMTKPSPKNLFSSEHSISPSSLVSKNSASINITNNKIVKIIRGGTKAQSNPLGFFSVILNHNRKDNVESKFACKTSQCQFEKEMNIRDNDNIIYSNFD